jgi:hypothetical protein
VYNKILRFKRYSLPTYGSFLRSMSERGQERKEIHSRCKMALIPLVIIRKIAHPVRPSS